MLEFNPDEVWEREIETPTLLIEICKDKNSFDVSFHEMPGMIYDLMVFAYDDLRVEIWQNGFKGDVSGLANPHNILNYRFWKRVLEGGKWAGRP